MENSKNMGQLSFKLILLVRTGTEPNARSRTGIMTHKNIYFGNYFIF